MGQYHVIVNLTKKQFISPSTFGDGIKLMEFGMSGEGGVLTALTVLLAAANRGGARGGGDFYSNHPLVGSWAGDEIAIIGDYANLSDLPISKKAHLIYSLCCSKKETFDRADFFENRKNQRDADWLRSHAGTYEDVGVKVRKLIADTENVSYYMPPKQVWTTTDNKGKKKSKMYQPRAERAWDQKGIIGPKPQVEGVTEENKAVNKLSRL